MIRNVCVGISGGVDSAVAALLVKKLGYNVTGVFMKNWDENEESGDCSISRDREDARSVCEQVGIAFHEVNFVKNYWCHVFSYLIDEYKNGCTPNPDVLCNRHIKFDAFTQYCFNELSADAVATGHYARTSYGPYLENSNRNEPVRLLNAADSFKDQTFFLSQVCQESLQKIMFPLGGYLKSDVRKIAKTYGLERILKRRESTGICFIGKRNFQNFINSYIEPKPGSIVDLSTSRIIGKHNGLHMWTLGQCSHVAGFKERIFVARKDVLSNVMYVVPGTSHSSLFTKFLYTSEPHWIAENPMSECGPMDCWFRFQHTKPKIACQIHLVKSGMIILLRTPLKAITQGQFAVLYGVDECLGSARILRPGPSEYYLERGSSVDKSGKFCSIDEIRD